MFVLKHRNNKLQKITITQTLIIKIFTLFETCKTYDSKLSIYINKINVGSLFLHLCYYFYDLSILKNYWKVCMRVFVKWLVFSGEYL